ncbi:hypothetical protein [Neisseria sp. S1]|uniref:hypothetical protein n=1 Tax=Neisseria sp. S1 TaxID=3318354 RepID=UPI003A8B7595
MAGLCTEKVHGMVIGEDETYLCSSALDGTLYVVNGRTGQGYAIDHKELIKLAKDNNWSECTESGYGIMLNSGEALMLRQEVGSGKMGEKEYAMQLSLEGTPIVESKTTGKKFMLTWDGIVKLAVEAGIDDSDASEESKV